jgi:hypothetical protein
MAQASATYWYVHAHLKSDGGRRHCRSVLEPLKAHRPVSRCGKPKLPNESADLLPMVREIQAGGAGSLRHIAAVLNTRGIPAPRGG